MDDAQRALIKEISFEAANVIKEELMEFFQDSIKLHIAQCPAQEAVKRWPKQIEYLIIGVRLGSGALCDVILKIFKLL